MEGKRRLHDRAQPAIFDKCPYDSLTWAAIAAFAAADLLGIDEAITTARFVNSVAMLSCPSAPQPDLNRRQGSSS